MDMFVNLQEMLSISLSMVLLAVIDLLFRSILIIRFLIGDRRGGGVAEATVFKILESITVWEKVVQKTTLRAKKRHEHGAIY